MNEGEAGSAKTAQQSPGQKVKKPRKPRTTASDNGGDDKVKAIQTIVASEKFIVVAATDDGVIQVLSSWA